MPGDPFTEQHRRQLQGLMQDPRWGAVEAFVSSYMLRNFTAGTIRRSTEFDTLWYAAEAEGAQRNIRQLFTEMEREAHNAETS